MGHVHRALAARRHMHGFARCVAIAGHCDPRSHGGVCFTDHCRCGATRDSNITAPGRQEVSDWHAPLEAAAADLRAALIVCRDGLREVLFGASDLSHPTRRRHAAAVAQADRALAKARAPKQDGDKP